MLFFVIKVRNEHEKFNGKRSFQRQTRINTIS